MFTDIEVSRFWAKVDKSEACWLWTASVGNHGYGQMGARGTVMLAHRISYLLAHGSIPDGFTVDHICHNKRCVNPAHLEAVTLEENVKRAWAAGRYGHSPDVCAHGHPRTPDNWRRKADGSHYCRVCHRDRQRRQRFLKLQAAKAAAEEMS